jgi:hypothetical protein
MKQVFLLAMLAAFTSSSKCDKVVRETRCSERPQRNLPMCSEVRHYCEFDCREKARKVEKAICFSRCVNDSSCDSKDNEGRLACFDSCSRYCNL